MNATPERITFNPFVPLLLLSMAVLLLVVWNLKAAVGQRMAGLRLQEQQEQQVAQAATLENKLRQMMTDLVMLAKRDPSAADLVARYGVTFNPPSGSPLVPAAATPPVPPVTRAPVTPAPASGPAPAAVPAP